MRNIQYRVNIEDFNEATYSTFDEAFEAFMDCGIDWRFEGEYQTSNRTNKREWVASLELWRENEDDEMEYVGTIDSVEYGWREHCIMNEMHSSLSEDELKAGMVNLAKLGANLPESEDDQAFDRIRREVMEGHSPEQVRQSAARENEWVVDHA